LKTVDTEPQTRGMNGAIDVHYPREMELIYVFLCHFTKEPVKQTEQRQGSDTTQRYQ